MNDGKNPNDKLERLLTAWGGQRLGRPTEQCLTPAQAAKFVKAGPTDSEQATHVQACPVCARLVGRFEQDQTLTAEESLLLPIPTISRLRRFAPLAAGLVLAVAGVVMLVQSHPNRSGDELGGEPGKPMLTDTRPAELAGLREANQKLLTDLATLQGEKDRDRATFQARLDELMQADQERIAALTRQVGEYQQEAQRVKAQADLAAAELTKLRGTLAKDTQVETDLANKIVALNQANQELAGQVDRLRAQQNEQSAAVRATWRMLVGEHPAARVNPKTLAAMQSAAKQSALASRAGKLALAAPDTASRQLLGKLEMVLSRLEMADPNDPAEQKWMSNLATGGLTDRLDEALGGQDARNLSDDARTLLSLTQVILLRGACAS